MKEIQVSSKTSHTMDTWTVKAKKTFKFEWAEKTFKFSSPASKRSALREQQLFASWGASLLSYFSIFQMV